MATHSSILAWIIPMDRGAWWTIVHGVAKSQTWLSDFHTSGDMRVPPGGSDGKESTCQSRRPGFIPWVGKIPWSRAWQPTPVLLPGKSPWTEEPGGLQPMGLQRVRHD